MGFTNVDRTETDRLGMVDTRDVAGLYEEVGPRLRGLAVAITFDRSLAEEVVQDAFVGLLRKQDPVGDPVGYLHRSVVNGAIDRVRRRNRFRGLPKRRPTEVLLPDLDEIWQHVARLPAQQRAIVALRFYEDLTYGEIAATLEIPAGSVKSGLHRAMKALKEQL